MHDGSLSAGRLVPIDSLRRWLVMAFQRMEWSDAEAEQVADVYLDSELRGHESHGVFGLIRLLDSPDQARPPREIRALRETEHALLLDGGGSRVVADVRAMRWCIDSARNHGTMAMAGVQRSQPIVPGYFARMAADAGLIGFACTNAIPMVAPPGGRTPTLGTNPLAYGIPAGRYPPIVLDMATTSAAAYSVRLAAQQGRALPIGTVLDSEGNPTTDPTQFLAGGLMAPLGSPNAPHKGFGLALVVDVLAGVLTGSAFARDLGDDANATGNFFWALDPEVFLPPAEFAARMEAQIEQIRAAAGATDGPVLPGERGHRRYEELMTRGAVPLSDTTWAVIEKTCAALELPLP
jgi:LDH2 family malate/lactate/ureidoglycolate dehydrogenase